MSDEVVIPAIGYSFTPPLWYLMRGLPVPGVKELPEERRARDMRELEAEKSRNLILNHSFRLIAGLWEAERPRRFEWWAPSPIDDNDDYIARAFGLTESFESQPTAAAQEEAAQPARTTETRRLQEAEDDRPGAWLYQEALRSGDPELAERIRHAMSL
jgi:hypothetical protein